MAKPTDELIAIDEIVSVKRGRKATYDGNLLDSLKKLDAPGMAMRLNSFGQVPADKRSNVGGKIRKHFAQVFPDGKCSVLWTPDGIAQVKRTA